jgi:hypothetical protein
MIVDDSAIVRQVASEAIAAQPDMEVLATASDPLFAMDKMRGPGRDRPRHRDAAHGRADLPAQADGRAADAGGDLLVAGGRAPRPASTRWRPAR